MRLRDCFCTRRVWRRAKRSFQNLIFCLLSPKHREKILIFGDSHGRFCFENFSSLVVNLSCNSVTMYRVGTMGVPFFCKKFVEPRNRFVFCFGEIDCRNHIARQVGKGRVLDEIIRTLVDAYFEAIAQATLPSKRVVVCSLPPPASFREQNVSGYTDIPFAGSDADRASFTKQINQAIFAHCQIYNFYFLDIYHGYETPEGMLNLGISDGICHITNNLLIRQRLATILKKMPVEELYGKRA